MKLGWPRAWRRKSAADNTLELFREIYGGRLSKAGEPISWKTALQVSTVLACCRVIADGVAQVPLKLFLESADGRSRLPAKEHPLYDLLRRRPNAWQTSYEYRELIVLHAVLVGNHFSFINRRNGVVRELIPLEPGSVTVKRADDTTLTYVVTGRTGSQEFPAEAIWHVRGPSWNGWQGMETVQLAREAIGLAIAAEAQHSRSFANGVTTTGIYSVEGTLNQEQYKSLRKFIVDNHSGANSGAPMILDRSAKWLTQAMTGVDAQHLETRRFQVEEVCRAMRVMPLMVGMSDKASTYASAEQMFLAHVVHTLAPWYERLEQSIDVNLLTDKDRAGGLYVKFVEEGLLRGAMKDTSEFLVKLTNAGVMTRNEARRKLDMNPIEGLDEPLTPANMNVGAKPEPEPDPESDPDADPDADPETAPAKQGA